MEDKSLYSNNEFTSSSIFMSYNLKSQSLLKCLFNKLSIEGVEFVIKHRRDMAIALSLKDKPQKNIATIWIYEQHIRLSVYNEFDKKIQEPDDLDKNLINSIVMKYKRYSKERKQLTIYLDEDIYCLVDENCKNEKKKINDYIVDVITEKTRDVFLNDRHKEEFINFIRDNGLEDLYSLKYEEREKKKKIIAFFYLISPYQDEYFETTGEKFKYDIKTNTLSGPVFLFKEWELGCCDRETMLGLGLYILNEKESLATLQDILMFMDESYMYFLAMNAFKILGEQLQMVGGNLCKPVPEEISIINLDDLMKSNI